MHRGGGDERDGVEVGVGEHEARRLAAELEHRRLQGLGAGGEDLRAAVGPPVKLIFCTSGWRTSASPASAVPGQHVDDARRDARPRGRGHEVLHGVGRQLGRLDHDGVPGGERRHHLHPDRDERAVPGDDDPDDAVGLGDRVRELAAVGRRGGHPALDLVGPAGVVAGVVDHRGGREVGDAVGHAVVEDRQPGQLVLRRRRAARRGGRARPGAATASTSARSRTPRSPPARRRRRRRRRPAAPAPGPRRWPGTRAGAHRPPPVVRRSSPMCRCTSGTVRSNAHGFPLLRSRVKLIGLETKPLDFATSAWSCQPHGCSRAVRPDRQGRRDHRRRRRHRRRLRRGARRGRAPRSSSPTSTSTPRTATAEALARRAITVDRRRRRRPLGRVRRRRWPQAAVDAFGGIDILVNNAAIMVDLPPYGLGQHPRRRVGPGHRRQPARPAAVHPGGVPAMEARGGGRIVNGLSAGPSCPAASTA